MSLSAVGTSGWEASWPRNAGRVTGRNDFEEPLTQDQVQLTEYARHLYRASQETDKDEQAQLIRDRLEKLRDDRSGIDAAVRSALKKNGITLADSRRLRLEVDGSGRIAAGGLSDKKLLKKIEAALNKEEGLAESIKTFQRDTRSLSAEIRKETGMSLDDVVKLMRQDSQSADPERAGLASGTDILANYVLFDENPDLLGLIGEVTSTSGIDISGGDGALSDPEGTIKAALQQTWQKITDGVNAYNDKVRAKLAEAGVKTDAEMDKEIFISLKGAAFTVTSDGAVEITGEFASNRRTVAEAHKIFEACIQEMLSEAGRDGETNPFSTACERVLGMYADAFGDDAAEDAVVTAKIGAGASMRGEVSLSSAFKEEEIRQDMQAEVNTLLQSMGIETDIPVEIAVSDSGKITAVNLDMFDDVTKRMIEAAAESINIRASSGTDDDPEYDRLKKLRRHHLAFQPGGVGAIRDAFRESMEKDAEETAPALSA